MVGVLRDDQTHERFVIVMNISLAILALLSSILAIITFMCTYLISCVIVCSVLRSRTLGWSRTFLK